MNLETPGLADKLSSQRVIAVRICTNGRWEDALITKEIANDEVALGKVMQRLILQVALHGKNAIPNIKEKK